MALIEVLSGTASKITSAIAIFLIGMIIGRILGRILTLVLIEYEAERFLKKIGGASAAFFFGALISYIVYFITILITLNQFGIRNITAISVSSIIVIVIFVSAILGTRDLIQNVLAYFAQKINLKKGDIVQFSNKKGVILKRDFVKVKLKTKEGDIMILPNSGLSEINIKKIKTL